MVLDIWMKSIAIIQVSCRFALPPQMPREDQKVAHIGQQYTCVACSHSKCYIYLTTMNFVLKVIPYILE